MDAPPALSSTTKTVLATCGATHPFPQLILTLLTPRIQHLLHSLGYTHLILQHGILTPPSSSPTPSSSPSPLSTATSLLLSKLTALDSTAPTTLKITHFSHTPSLHTHISTSDLIISHAGSGTILEALRCGKRLVVVPNEELMDGHQAELAAELERLGYLVEGRVGGKWDEEEEGRGEGEREERQGKKEGKGGKGKGKGKGITGGESLFEAIKLAEGMRFKQFPREGSGGLKKVVDEEMGWSVGESKEKEKEGGEIEQLD